MAVLPVKLVHYLNNQYEYGSFKLGKELQRCLTEISNNPGSGACITVPAYTSNAAAEAACGKIAGNLYYNSVTDTLVYCDDNGNWINIDIEGLTSTVTQNSADITLNQTNISVLVSQLTALQTAFDNHNHDGVNSSPVDIKNLVTTEPAGSYFFSTGSGIDCGPIQQGVSVSEGANIVEAQALNIDFTAACFAITSTGTNSILVDIPDLPQLKLDVAANTTSLTTNNTAISNLSTQVVNATNIATNNQTNLNTLNTEFDAHCHDGTDSPAIRIDKILSQDGTGTNLANNFTICSDGAGGWTYVDKSTFSGTAVTATNVGPGADILAATSTASNFDIKGITSGCGITTNVNATDIEVAIDFAGMANVGTAIDPAVDTILVHDNSTNTCVQTSLQSLMTAIASKEYFAGKGLDRTTDGVTGDCTFDLDLPGITAKVAADEIDTDADYIVYYDASESDCKTAPFSDLPSDNVCCLPDPGGLSLLDPVYVDSLGVVTKSDISDGSTVAQYVVVGFKTNQVCIQDSGPITLNAPHGLTVGDCYFEGPAGTATATQPTSGINNVLYHVVSTTKLSIISSTRPYEIGSAGSAAKDSQYSKAERTTATGSQAVPANTITNVGYTEVVDLNNNFALNTYTVPVDGLYQISGGASVVVPSGARAIAFIRINNSPNRTLYPNTDVGGPAIGPRIHTSGTELLSAGDTINIAVFFSDAGTVEGDSDFSVICLQEL